ncbi:alkaline phosphatase family protein [Lacibacter sediminis]|uniref:Alkaline phosphatase family protein n=1 Tax=Lacibacter sediminis TaxID=2760713 RepID=A0A7G5XFM3_9BACT|nr:alkaline phosphatase family protein [Lacibacter sediminis]QNA44276.1 alkaline phosphatase family protein [Lacibacter sediminis]
MKRICILLLAVCISTIVFAQKKKKAVFIIVDGIPADVLEKINTPMLDSIAKVGGYSRIHVGGEKGGYSQTPTISAVGYNSLLTGTWVNKHNVWDNDIAAPNYNYPTIFRLLKTQSPQKKIAVFSSWLDNRTKLAGDGLPATQQLKVDYHFDGLELDTVTYPHDREKKYMNRIDEAVAGKAADCIQNESPDLSWVYLEYTDDMGHRYGDSKQFYDAVELMDKQVGRVWQAVQYRMKHFNEDWQIYITTDHGRDAATGKGHGGQSERERTTWIVTNAKGLNGYFKSGKAAIVDIMPSIASFMDISIPKEQLMEIDGISLTGNLSVTEMDVRYENGTILLNWKGVANKGKLKVWLSTSNHYKTGGKDQYELMQTVPTQKGKTIINVKEKPSAFYKLVIEAPHNFLNRWILIP